jgi:hypothetical protein
MGGHPRYDNFEYPTIQLCMSVQASKWHRCSFIRPDGREVSSMTSFLQLRTDSTDSTDSHLFDLTAVASFEVAVMRHPAGVQEGWLTSFLSHGDLLELLGDGEGAGAHLERWLQGDGMVASYVPLAAVQWLGERLAEAEERAAAVEAQTTP